MPTDQIKPLLCGSCKTPLNTNAKRCASCGSYVGYIGKALFYAALAGAVTTVLSLLALTSTSIIDVFGKKTADLRISLYEVRFQEIDLTCKPHDGDDYVETFFPHTNGNTPGRILRVRGSVYNAGNLAGEIELLGGSLFAPNLEVDQMTAVLAGFDPPVTNGIVFAEPGTTTHFTFEASVRRVNKDGYYFTEIEYLIPPSGEPINHGRLGIALSFLRFEQGRIIDEYIHAVVPATIESPLAHSWTVEGPLEDVSWYVCDTSSPEHVIVETADD